MKPVGFLFGNGGGFLYLWEEHANLASDGGGCLLLGFLYDTGTKKPLCRKLQRGKMVPEKGLEPPRA